MKAHAPIFAAALLALAPCQAQVKIGGGVLILNGRNGSASGAAETPADDANPATGQVLEFADGNQLHGVLEKVDSAKKEVVWRGEGAATPLTFPLAQVSHVDFNAKAKTDAKANATVQLSGGDWLTAEVTGLREDRLQLRLGDGTALSVDRAFAEWIYFSRGAAVESYDGPQSLAGWVSSGGWTYREGALRATQPSVVGRFFEALPDRVEYRFEFDHGTSYRAFAVLLHGTEALSRNIGTGVVRLMVNDTNFQLLAQTGDTTKQEQVDLAKILPAAPKAVDGSPTPPKKPLRWRIFEDRPAGRIVVFINGRKVGDWTITKGKAGENRGSFSFQPMASSSNVEQSLSKIRVAPWDGFVPVDDALESIRPKTDQVILADGETKAGRIESITADKVKIGGAVVAREKIAQLRFARPETPPDEDPPVGRVRLAQRGEFEVAALHFADEKLQVRTNFGGELTLPAAALRQIEFGHLQAIAGQPADLLIFKNGDQLRGLLETAASGQKLRWRAAAATPPVEMETARMAGVLLAPRADRPAAKLGMLARFRNGDFLAGDLVSLDKDQLVLDNGAAGRISLPRDRVQTLHFASGDKLPVLDGTTDRELWEAGLEFNKATAELRKKRIAEGKVPPNPWSYFDGAFTVRRATPNRANSSSGGNINLGRVIEEMPPRVDFSFDVIGKKNQLFFTAYLFSEPENSGYIMQFHQSGLFIYDTGGQQRGRAMIQQQQIQFGDKVKADAPQHRVRVLADRPAGRLTVLVDEVVVANFGPKAGAQARNLGRGLGLMPQQQNIAVTFANLWVAPWNGQLPEKAAAGTAPPDSILLANGDEAQGKIGSSTPEALQLESEVGLLDLPLKRVTTIDFGGRKPESSTGVRLRLSDRSVLTVASYRIENDTVICQSVVAGELRFPVSAVQELVFAPPTPATPKPDGKTGAAGAVPAGVILQGNVQVRFE